MRWLAVLGLTMLATVAAAGGATGPARAGTIQPGAPACVVNYGITAAYTGGFYGQITVELSGFQAGLGWELTFNFVSPDQRIVLLPNEQWSQSGENVVIGNQSQATPADGSIQFSFIADDGADNPPPVNFTFNGVPCTTGAVLPQ